MLSHLKCNFNLFTKVNDRNVSSGGCRVFIGQVITLIPLINLYFIQ